MNHLLDKRGLLAQVECDSAGTSGYHVGAAPDRRMSAAAQRKLGFALQGRSRRFESHDFDEFDLILAMDQDNYEQLYYLDRQGQYRHKLRMMCEFCRQYDLKAVPDPYYGGEAGFDFVIDLLMDACAGLLDELIATEAIVGVTPS
jgi:protein-tyrosine phosphatase